MPAEPAGRGGHHVREARAAQGRHRIRPRARALEDVAPFVYRAAHVPGLAGYADFHLHLVVVGLQFVVAERPVLDRRTLRDARGAVSAARLADHLEVPRVQPPALCPVVERRAADGVHHRVNRASGRRRRGRGGAMRGDLAIGLLHRLRPAAIVVAQFVGGEVGGREPCPGFEAHDVEPRLCQWQHRHATRGAHAHHDDVGARQLSRIGHVVRRFRSAKHGVVVGRHVELARTPVEALLVRRHRQPDAGIAHQVPADEVAVAAVEGIAEGALERVVQHQVEEGGSPGRAERGHRVPFEGREQLVLIGLGELREPAALGLPRVGVEAREA